MRKWATGHGHINAVLHEEELPVSGSEGQTINIEQCYGARVYSHTRAHTERGVSETHALHAGTVS